MDDKIGATGFLTTSHPVSSCLPGETIEQFIQVRVFCCRES
jgi:hypothetical protein